MPRPRSISSRSSGRAAVSASADASWKCPVARRRPRYATRSSRSTRTRSSPGSSSRCHCPSGSHSRRSRRRSTRRRTSTAQAAIEILKRSGVELAGKRVVVVGRSNVVGKPVALLLLREHATVTVCHSRTPDLAARTRTADIVVVAAGRPGLITGSMIKRGAVVVDVGINVVGDKLVGDVDAASVSPVAAALTPVPGGVGPVTNALLMTHLVRAAELQARAETPRPSTRRARSTTVGSTPGAAPGAGSGAARLSASPAGRGIPA